jgi:hypothetical protein
MPGHEVRQVSPADPDDLSVNPRAPECSLFQIFGDSSFPEIQDLAGLFYREKLLRLVDDLLAVHFWFFPVGF